MFEQIKGALQMQIDSLLKDALGVSTDVVAMQSYISRSKNS